MAPVLTSRVGYWFGTDRPANSVWSGNYVTLTGLIMDVRITIITSSVCNQHLLTRVPTGQGKLGKVREFVWSGKGQGKVLFLKSQGK